MIKYLEEIEKRYIKNSDIELNRDIHLEDTLRLLGNFSNNDPIIVKECKNSNDGQDIIYIVSDLDDNIFMFKNFDIGKELTSNKRFRENYHLNLTKKNSNITYKYDFKEELKLIGLSYRLTDTRVVKLEKVTTLPLKVIIEEANKEYILGYYDNSENLNEYLIENLETIINNIRALDTLSLDNIVSAIPSDTKINYGLINEDNKPVASIHLENGTVTQYEMSDEYRKIITNIDDYINRRVEDKKGKTICSERLPKNTGVIELEVKRLMKVL